MGLEVFGRQRPRLAAGNVNRHRIRNEPLEADLVERVTARYLVRRSVYVRTDVIQEVVLRHRVAVLLDLCDGYERRGRQPWKDGHPVLVGLRKIDDAHPGVGFDSVTL